MKMRGSAFESSDLSGIANQSVRQRVWVTVVVPQRIHSKTYLGDSSVYVSRL